MSLEPKTIMAKDKSGLWHVALATYPNTTDTACGKRDMPVTVFSTRGNPDLWPPARECEACLVAFMIGVA